MLATILMILYVARKTYIHQNLKEIKKQVGEKTEVSVLSENGMKKYVAGSFKSYDEAAQFRNTLAEKGFKGCFVVAYSNGKRVSF